MAIAFAPTSKSLPPACAITATAKVTCYASSSYSPRFCSFSNGINIRLRNRRTPPLLVKCGAGVAVREIDEAHFSDVVLKSDSPVLVEFVATWCGPCRLIAPAVQALAQEYEGKLRIVKVDHDANPRLIEEYKVYGLPALIMFQNGKEVPDSRREGAITKAKLKEYIDKLLDSVSVT